MSGDIVQGWATVYPHIRYEQPVEAIAWLSRAFGFRERVRMARPDGSFITAKVETPGGGLVMVAGSSPDSPSGSASACQIFASRRKNRGRTSRTRRP
jgi:uncharacterized glyoxalase superfamily protein PhnB